MTQLTQDYFDEVVKWLATKEDLERFATKADLTSLEQRLKTDTDASIERLAQMVQSGFESLEHRIDDLDLRRRVETLERQMEKLVQALNVKL